MLEWEVRIKPYLLLYANIREAFATTFYTIANAVLVFATMLEWEVRIKPYLLLYANIREA
jgi:Na+/serine symporter